MNHVDPRIPSVIHEFWATLTAEVVWLHGRWIIYRQLYGTSEEQIDVLNRSASTFFVVLNRTLLNDVQLSLSKLGDPARTGRRRRNMTLNALVEELEGVGETAVIAKLKPLVEIFDQACTKLRHRRNKWIAHFDLPTMLNAKVVPLEGPSRAEIEAALVALREAVNCVQLHYTDTQTAHELFSMTHDGESLLATLKRGLRYSELVKEGSIARDDLRKNFRLGA